MKISQWKCIAYAKPVKISSSKNLVWNLLQTRGWLDGTFTCKRLPVILRQPERDEQPKNFYLQGKGILEEVKMKRLRQSAWC